VAVGLVVHREGRPEPAFVGVEQQIAVLPLPAVGQRSVAARTTLLELQFLPSELRRVLREVGRERLPVRRTSSSAPNETYTSDGLSAMSSGGSYWFLSEPTADTNGNFMALPTTGDG
jgi:hypothetical protein